VQSKFPRKGENAGEQLLLHQPSGLVEISEALQDVQISTDPDIKKWAEGGQGGVKRDVTAAKEGWGGKSSERQRARRIAPREDV
jgi:hypothetical protein